MSNEDKTINSITEDPNKAILPLISVISTDLSLEPSVPVPTPLPIPLTMLSPTPLTTPLTKEKIKVIITRKPEPIIGPKEETVAPDNEDKETEDMEDSSKRFYCYILKNSVPSEMRKTYNGFTVDLKKRIRQHNSEIKGGAKYTTTNGRKSWHYYAILTGFRSNVSALSCEWWIKHPTGGRRPLKYSGPRGRILGLQRVTEETRFKGYDKNLEYTLWIDRTYLNCLNPKTMKPNIKIMTFSKMDDVISYYENQV